MKLTSPLLSLALTLLGTGSLRAAVTEYTDRAAFLAALPAGYFSTDFSGLTGGDQGATSLAFSGGSPAVNLTIASRNAANTGPGDFLYLSELGDVDAALGNTTTVTDQLWLSAPGLYAIGGDWFLSDFEENYFAGSVNLAFSGSDTFTVTSVSLADSFRGYISDAPLTGLLVSAAGGIPATDRWVTVDNLAAAAVPEPAGAVMAVLGLGVVAGTRRRR